MTIASFLDIFLGMFTTVVAYGKKPRTVGTCDGAAVPSEPKVQTLSSRVQHRRNRHARDQNTTDP